MASLIILASITVLFVAVVVILNRKNKDEAPPPQLKKMVPKKPEPLITPMAKREPEPIQDTPKAPSMWKAFAVGVGLLLVQNALTTRRERKLDDERRLLQNAIAPPPDWHF